VPVVGNGRTAHLFSGFQWRLGVWPGVEWGGQLPIVFNVYSPPPSLTAASGRRSGGGLGDVSLWVKYRWWTEGPWSSAVWAGYKWPTGTWKGLDPAQLGMDQTGTGSQDIWGGLALGYAWGGGVASLNVFYTVTGPKSYRDESGALIEQDDGDVTRVTAGVTGDVGPDLAITAAVLLESTSRAWWWRDRISNGWRSDPRWISG